MKNISGTGYLLEHFVVSWSSRKQNCLALSIIKTEYITLGSCYAQAFWMTSTLKDSGLKNKKVPF